MSQRLKSLDTTKGLLIVLVVLGHLLLFTGAYPIILKIIYSFHMVSFLCISGIQWNNQKYINCSFRSFFERRVLKLIVCYFIFEFLAVGIKLIFAWGQPENVLTILLNIISGNGYIGADWYLYTYVFAVILVFYLFKGNRILSVSGLLVIEAFILYYLNNNQSEIVLKLSRIIIFVIVITIANLFKSILLQKRHIAIITLIAVLFCASSLYNDNVFLNASIVGNPLLFLMSGFSGFILVLQLSLRLKTDFFSQFGKKSLYIMGTHQNIEYVIDYFFGSSQNIGFLLLSFSAMLIGSLLLAWPLSKFVDKLFVERK